MFFFNIQIFPKMIGLWPKWYNLLASEVKSQVKGSGCWVPGTSAPQHTTVFLFNSINIFHCITFVPLIKRNSKNIFCLCVIGPTTMISFWSLHHLVHILVLMHQQWACEHIWLVDWASQSDRLNFLNVYANSLCLLVSHKEIDWILFVYSIFLKCSSVQVGFIYVAAALWNEKNQSIPGTPHAE